MSKICIFTDSSVHFPNPNFNGLEHVTVLPLHIKIGENVIQDSKDPKDYIKWLADLHNQKLSLVPVQVDEFKRLFRQLSAQHYNIIAILHSQHLSQTYQNANIAARTVKHSQPITLIDSQTFGPGLGLLVQTAAQAISQNKNFNEVNQLVRAQLPLIYTACFLPNLSFLANSGYLDPAQAVVGEMLNIIPFYVMDSGKLVSIQKARNSRQLVDLLYEFVIEFFELSHIALLQGYPPYEQDIRNLRERITSQFPTAPITEHNISLSMLSLLGPNSIGVVTMEKVEIDR